MSESHSGASPTDAAVLRKLQQTLNRILIGQEAFIDHILIALLAAGHVLIEGVPGLGKTLLVRALSKSFHGKFSRIQFTPDLMPSDVTGHVILDMASGSFRIRRGPVFTHLLLADEINRAPAKTQAALLEVMQEKQVTLEGEAQSVPQPFMVLATQNPIEQEGTYPLPEAQLDRFIMKLKLDYPQQNAEYQLVKWVTQTQVGDAFALSGVEAFLSPEGILNMQRQTAEVTVDDAVNRYSVDIVRATRQWPGISVGAGPRGGIAIIRCARALALLQQRRFITPDDVKSVVLPTLRHRILLSPEMQMEGVDADYLLAQILDKVPAPRQ